MTLTDVTMLDGKHLDMTKLKGQPSLNSSKPHGPIIHQERPAELEWALWRKANLLWSDKTGQLYEPLGPWTLPIAEQRHTHHGYRQYDQLCGADTVLYVRIDKDYIAAVHPSDT